MIGSPATATPTAGPPPACGSRSTSSPPTRYHPTPPGRPDDDAASPDDRPLAQPPRATARRRHGLLAHTDERPATGHSPGASRPAAANAVPRAAHDPPRLAAHNHPDRRAS